MDKIHLILLSAILAICASQRSPYAGRRPIGYPVIETTASSSLQNSALGNRFGRNGDFNRLDQLPQDRQPFWYVNREAIKQQREQPQTYPQRPNVFANNPAISVQNTQSIPNSKRINIVGKSSYVI